METAALNDDEHIFARYLRKNFEYYADFYVDLSDFSITQAAEIIVKQDLAEVTDLMRQFYVDTKDVTQWVLESGENEYESKVGDLWNARDEDRKKGKLAFLLGVLSLRIRYAHAEESIKDIQYVLQLLEPNSMASDMFKQDLLDDDIDELSERLSNFLAGAK